MLLLPWLQAYIIATSAQVDISKVDVSTFDDSYFKKQASLCAAVSGLMASSCEHLLARVILLPSSCEHLMARVILLHSSCSRTSCHYPGCAALMRGGVPWSSAGPHGGAVRCMLLCSN